MCPSDLFYEHGESFNMHRRTEEEEADTKRVENDGIDPALGAEHRGGGTRGTNCHPDMGRGEERSILDALPHWQSCTSKQPSVQ